MDRLHEGFRRYRGEVFPHKQERYQSVVSSQNPVALFLTCGDSRVDPELITGSGPGEIFVERNPGNLVPVYDERAQVGVSASIEYALAALQVRFIVVCGHSDCGAMKAVLKPQSLDSMPAVRQWLAYAAKPQNDDLESLTRRNVLLQIENLKTHPQVARRLASDELKIAGWVFDIGTGNIDVYDELTGRFAPIL